MGTEKKVESNLFNASRRPKGPSEVDRICLLFGSLWERKYPGQRYVITQADRKWALDLKGRPDEEIVARAQLYFTNTYHAVHCHQFRSFVSNYNSFIVPQPKPRPVNVSTQPKKETMCRDCGTELVDDLCPSCFPKCAQCGERHAKGITCEEAKASQKWLATMMAPQASRSGGSIRSIQEVLTSHLKKGGHA